MDDKFQEQFNKDIGNSIKKARKEKGITLEQLGYILGISKSSMWLIEKGKQPITLFRANLIESIIEADIRLYIGGYIDSITKKRIETLDNYNITKKKL